MPQQPILPVANFEMDNNTGPAPLSVRFTDLFENAVSWSLDFESDGNIDSTDKDPVYMFTTPGTYTITLSVTNENGAASKMEVVTVTQPVENDSANDVTIAGNNTVRNTGENTPENTVIEVSSGNNAAENGGTGDNGTDYSQTEDSEDGDSGSSHRVVAVVEVQVFPPNLQET
jgi:PKD repeat protein